jgi:hypothetical protein
LQPSDTYLPSLTRSTQVPMLVLLVVSEKAFFML